MSPMLPDAPSIAADDVVEMLRRHYLPDGRPPGGIFAGEIESPDHRRRADALWCPWSIAGGSGIVGHEVKVARSDVLAELADPMKADPWARYCAQWWLVVSAPALVEGLDIPAAWGIMAPPSGRRRRSMTVLRPAPALKPADTGPAWRRITAWHDNRLSTKLRDLEWRAERAARDAEHARAELDGRRAAELGRLDHRAEKIGRILAELDQRWGMVTDDEVADIVAAIVDVREHRRLADRARSEIRYLANQARRMLEPVDRIGRDLDRLAKGDAP
jgi:hypothetical protein